MRVRGNVPPGSEGRIVMVMVQRHVRKVLAGAAGVLMLILTIGSSVSAGAAAPTNVFTANGCPVGNYACLGYDDPRFYPGVAYGVVPYVAGRYVAPVGYAAPGAYSYFDPRYCGDGRVSVVPDATGNLINICTSTGARIFPAYAVGYPYGTAVLAYR
jgi:hypothetical protein